MGIKKRLIQYGYKKGEPEVRKAVNKSSDKASKKRYKKGESTVRRIVLGKKKKNKKKHKK